MSGNLNLDSQGLIWGKWKINDKLWILTNRWANFCYLIIGEEKAALLDTGCGEGNIREVAESITSLPVIPVLTHGHWDHSGGVFWWDQCYCMENSKEDFYVDATESIINPWEEKMPPDFKWNIMQEGDVLDLGGRHLEVFSMTAHAKSGLALLDRENRLLFTGDEIDPGQVLLLNRPELGWEEQIRLQMSDMEKLLKRESEYDCLYSAHNGIQLSKDYVRDYHTLCRMLLEGTAEYKDNVAGFSWPADPGDIDGMEAFYPARRAEFGVASLVFK